MKVKLKTEKQLKKLVKEGKIKLLSTSDEGSVVYGVPSGPYTFLFQFHKSAHGEVYEVVDADHCITKHEYDPRDILFKEVK